MVDVRNPAGCYIVDDCFNNPPSVQLPQGMPQEVNFNYLLDPNANTFSPTNSLPSNSNLQCMTNQQILKEQLIDSYNRCSSGPYNRCSSGPYENQFASSDLCKPYQQTVWEDFKQNGTDMELNDLSQNLHSLSLYNKIPSSEHTWLTTSNSRQDQAVLTKSDLLELLYGDKKSNTPQRVSFSTGRNCAFCRKNGESSRIYSSHDLKDKFGNVTCPVLYAYTCPICGVRGSKSHTVKYCPKNNLAKYVDIRALSRRTAAGRKRLSSLPL